MRFARSPSYEVSLGYLDRLDERSELCLGAFIGGQLICYGFVSARPTDIDSELRFHFPERWLYVYKIFTLPEYRGHELWSHLFAGGLKHVEEWLGDIQEPAGFVTLVVSDNTACLEALRRIGFQHQEDFQVLRVRSQGYPVGRPFTPQADFFIHRIDGEPVHDLTS